MSLLPFFIPWEPSLMLIAIFTVTGMLYWIGERRTHVSLMRRSTFWMGWGLFYISLHTRIDYYAEHEFFAHRIQHFVIHHLAPLLIMASYPGHVLHAGLPLRWRRQLTRWRKTTTARTLSRIWLHPSLISLLFVVSALIWLLPSIQFISMLDGRIYRFMNWSVAITGLLYWWMVVDHRRAPPARMSAGLRVLSPALTMTPQILIGAIIAFTPRTLYPIFDLCGRAFGLPALIDQSIGGLIIWVPAALLEAAGSLIALRHWMRLSPTRTRGTQQISGGHHPRVQPPLSKEVPHNTHHLLPMQL